MLTHELGHPDEIISDNIQDIGSSRAWSDGEDRYDCETNVRWNEMKCASRSVPRRKRVRLYSGKQRSERRERKRDDETRRSDRCARYATCDGVVPRVSSVYYSYLISHIILYYYFIYYSIILYRFETSHRRSTVFRSRLPINFQSNPPIFTKVDLSCRDYAKWASNGNYAVIPSFHVSIIANRSPEFPHLSAHQGNEPTETLTLMSLLNAEPCSS